MTCEVCSVMVTELRRGRCWGCYTSWVENRPVGLGACCTMCGDRRRENLRSIELLGSWMPVCHNCATKAMKLDPLPQTVGEIRKALARDRRFDARRYGKSDTRVFPRERRSDDRRSVRALDRDDPVATEEDIVEGIEELAAELSREAPPERDELTRIRELPPHADPR